MRNERAWYLALGLSLLAALAACGGDEAAKKDDAGVDAGKPMYTPVPSTDAWTMLGYDLHSTYNNTHETKISTDSVKDLTEKWKIDTVGSMTSVACVIDDYAIVVAQGRTYKLSLADGSEIWANKQTASTSSAACTKDTVYVYAATADLVALDAKDGTQKWKVSGDEHALAAGFSSPVVAGDYVLVGSSSNEETSAVSGATFRGGVVAFDKETGEEKWRFYTADDGYSGAAVWSTVSVSLEDGIVYASTGNNYTGEANDLSDAIIALDLETGEKLWSRQCEMGDVFTIRAPQGNPDNDFGANPIVFDAKVDGKMRKLVGAGAKSGIFWVFDRLTGKDVWNVEVGGASAGSGGFLNNGAFDGERLIGASNRGTSTGPGSEPSNNTSGGGTTSRLVALDPSNGDVLWERQLPAYVWAPITIANGVGFVAVNKDMQAFDTATGEKLWSVSTDGTIGSGAAVANGRVVFGSGFTYTGAITRGNALQAFALP